MLSINMDDVMQVISNIKNYLIAFGVVLVLALIVMFAVRKMVDTICSRIKASTADLSVIFTAIFYSPFPNRFLSASFACSLFVCASLLMPDVLLTTLGTGAELPNR